MNTQRIIAITLLLPMPSLAQAFVGSSVGLSALCSLLALLLAAGVAFVVFFWYPIKRLIGSHNHLDLEDDSEGNQRGAR